MYVSVGKPLYDMGQECWCVMVDTDYDNYLMHFEEFNEAYSLYLEAGEF